jgi:hypothetical protein
MNKSEYTQKFPIVCCLCGDKINNVHQRHNCSPVMDAWCCSNCNKEVVLPRRIKAMFEQAKKSPTYYSTYEKSYRF